MIEQISVAIKCRVGEVLKPGIEKINIGRYTLSPLPSEPTGGFKTELLLTFKDELGDGRKHSYPQKEGKIILSWLSMILRQKLKASSFRLNNIQVPNSKKESISFQSPINFPENISDLYLKFKSLPFDDDNNLLERYVRACECYQEALLLSTSNKTLSFFLFVVCIECLSNKDYEFYEYLMIYLRSNKKKNITKREITDLYNTGFVQEYGLKTNFITFILSHFDGWTSEFNEGEFRNLLASIYKIRSMFTHNGEDLTKYIELVDHQLKAKSVLANIKNKSVELPGLDYLSKLVRTVLINFLEKQNISDCNNIPKLAVTEGIVNVIANGPMQSGNFVNNTQIKHRK